MDTANKVSKYADMMGYDVNAIGVPKTIDNDLCGTDHTPGFGSAAKFIATTIAELRRDTAVYAQKAVTVVEIMGRDAGWLTAAAALADNANGVGDNTDKDMLNQVVIVDAEKPVEPEQPTIDYTKPTYKTELFQSR